MLSICIPIYNREMCESVRQLASQVAHVETSCEIVCIDDGSDSCYREANKPLHAMCKYIELEQNVGRARIRNMFLQYAAFDYLLFLDCDSLPPQGFLARYADILGQRPPVVCGGRVYPAASDDPLHHLRYAYGTRCESRPAAYRRRHPYRSFMTNNFIVHRQVLQAVPFDERIARYGHEDTLFGYCLMQHHIPVLHVDNPVVNGDVETNALFLKKTQQGVETLVDIYGWKRDDLQFIKEVSLLSFYSRLRRLRLDTLAGSLFRLMRPALERGFLSGRHVSTKAFAFYKLGLFIQNNRIRAKEDDI